jgi:hypothetical protein
VRHKVRPLNPTQKQSLKEQIDNWIASGIIEKSNSPWGAGLVPALKKNGTIRWCCDFRQLNRVTIKDSYPLPNIEENLQSLSGSTVFTTLDSCGAYHSMEVEEESRPFTAFISPSVYISSREHHLDLQTYQQRTVD